jgi:glucose-6-phosphate isomerase
LLSKLTQIDRKKQIMALKNTNPTSTKAWKKLENHFQDMQHVSMQTLFSADAGRTDKMHLIWNDFLIDYSKYFD